MPDLDGRRREGGRRGLGVAGADAGVGRSGLFPRAPEICVEVLSPSNTEAEIKEKTALYFDAGAREVWLCAPEDGKMTFLGSPAAAPTPASKLCPRFPDQIRLG